MRTSEQIDKLATALAKAQGALDDASKSSINPHFKSRYASLDAVRTAIREPLSLNGLSYVQCARAGQGFVEVETVLMHASGQFIAETLTMPAAQNTAQGFGTALTYCRRYSLMAMVGIAAVEDDDDGHAATHQPPVKHDDKPPVQFSKPKEPAESTKAVETAREVKQCKTEDDIDALKRTPEFVAAWKNMNNVDRAYVANAVDMQRAILRGETPDLMMAG
jgi:hypothetical protein